MTKTNSSELLQEMEKQNLNPKEWVRLQEAASRCIYSKRQIKKLAEKGIERIGTKRIGTTVLYNMKHIMQYAANHQAQPILDTVWDELTFLPREHFYPILGYDYKYFISNERRVINTSNGQVLTSVSQQNIKGDLTGYSQVSLTKDGKTKPVAIHRLIGQTQCPNAFGKDIFHHIETAKHNGLYDDSVSNILPVWEYEHRKLHKLLNEGKRDEYNKLVDEIKKENAQKIYKIPDLDFKSDEHFNYWMLINEKGYEEYQANGDVPLDCIKMQIAEVK